VKAEFEFQDSTVVRIGSSTQLRFIPGTRDLFLDGGVALFHASKRAGFMRLQTSGVTISGLDFLAYNAAGRVKIVSLKRKVSVYFTNNPKIHVLGEAHMLDIPAGATTMPKRTEVDLNKLMATSLLGEAGGFDAFPGHEASANDGGDSGFSSIAAAQTAQATRSIETVAAAVAAQQQALLQQQEVETAQREQLLAQRRAEAATQLAVQQQQHAQQQQARDNQGRHLGQTGQQPGQGQQPGGGQGAGSGGEGGKGNQGKHLGQLK
jgi:hypothetical protein